MAFKIIILENGEIVEVQDQKHFDSIKNANWVKNCIEIIECDGNNIEFAELEGEVIAFKSVNKENDVEKPKRGRKSKIK